MSLSRQLPPELRAQLAPEARRIAARHLLPRHHAHVYRTEARRELARAMRARNTSHRRRIFREAMTCLALMLAARSARCGSVR